MTPRELTPRLSKALHSVGWATYWFGARSSRYANGNKSLRALESLGLVERIDGVEACDADGFAVDPPRTLTGWTLTERGVEACHEWTEDIRSHGRGPR